MTVNIDICVQAVRGPGAWGAVLSIWQVDGSRAWSVVRGTASRRDLVSIGAVRVRAAEGSRVRRIVSTPIYGQAYIVASSLYVLNGCVLRLWPCDSFFIVAFSLYNDYVTFMCFWMICESAIWSDTPYR